MIISASDSNLLAFMEMRHHAGAKVAVLVIDEQNGGHFDRVREILQSGVLRTAAILGCPTWFAELKTGATDTNAPLIRAAGFASGAVATAADVILKKGNKTNVFEGTNLSERLDGAGVDFLVVMGRVADCCVHHTILGTPPRPPWTPEPGAPLASSASGSVPRPGAKPLPVPPSKSAAKGPPEAASRVPSKPLPIAPSSAPKKPLPMPRGHNAPRITPMPSVPEGAKPSGTVKSDAVSHCIVLTSPYLVAGTLPRGVQGHPKCYVFECVGSEMWPQAASQRMADVVRSGAR